MVSPFQQELQSLQEEMTTSFSKLQARLTDIAHRSEEVDQFWQTRVVELENTVQETLSDSRLLTHQNAELERRIAQQNPEMQRAIDARLAVFRKLRNAYRVIVDLAERSQTVDLDVNQLTEEEIAEVLTDAFASERSQASDSSSESDETVHGVHGQGQDHHQNNGPATPAGRLEESNMNTVPEPNRITRLSSSASSSPRTGIKAAMRGGQRVVTYPSTAGSVANDPTNASINSSPASSSLSVHEAQLQIPATSEGPWQIHYSKIPGSSEGTCGPVSPNMLVTRLGLRKELRESLESLGLQDEFCLRIHIEGSFAFVYDPIFLEAPSQTLLLDWGGDLVNKRTERYITQNKNPAFHTFVFPVQKNNWFYVGAHTWKVEEIPSTWAELGSKSRRKIINKLINRSHGNVDEQDIIRRLDSRELREIYVRISSTGQYERSRDMARKMGFEDQIRVTNTNSAGAGASPRSGRMMMKSVPLPDGGSSTG